MPSLGLVDSVEGFFWNAATGTLTDAQKQSLIEQQAQDVATASGGSISVDTASVQAQQDVTTVLTMNKADPSQASLFNNPGLDSLLNKFSWILTIVLILALIVGGFKVYRVFKS